MGAAPLVHVVDDDPAVGRALENILASIGLNSRCYASAQDFWDAYDPEQPGCAVLDASLPGISGLDLQRRLQDGSFGIPTIVISGHGDIRMAVNAMKGGAVTFLEKPLEPDEFCQHVRQAIQLDLDQREAYRQRQRARQQVSRLTDKEREVMQLAAAGKTNREAAADLGLSLRAIEDRRSRMMKKLGIKTLTELIRLVNSAS